MNVWSWSWLPNLVEWEKMQLVDYRTRWLVVIFLKRGETEQFRYLIAFGFLLMTNEILFLGFPFIMSAPLFHLRSYEPGETQLVWAGRPRPEKTPSIPAKYMTRLLHVNQTAPASCHFYTDRITRHVWATYLSSYANHGVQNSCFLQARLEIDLVTCCNLLSSDIHSRPRVVAFIK